MQFSTGWNLSIRASAALVASIGEAFYVLNSFTSSCAGSIARSTPIPCPPGTGQTGNAGIFTGAAC
jgi:hypothetical protein